MNVYFDDINILSTFFDFAAFFNTTSFYAGFTYGTGNQVMDFCINSWNFTENENFTSPSLPPTPSFSSSPSVTPSTTPLPSIPSPSVTPSTISSLCNSSIVPNSICTNISIIVNGSIYNNGVIDIQQLLLISTYYYQTIDGVLKITITNDSSGSLLVLTNATFYGIVIITIDTTTPITKVLLVNASNLFVGNLSIVLINNNPVECKTISAIPQIDGNQLYAMLVVKPTCMSSNIIIGSVIGGMVFIIIVIFIIGTIYYIRKKKEI